MKEERIKKIVAKIFKASNVDFRDKTMRLHFLQGCRQSMTVLFFEKLIPFELYNYIDVAIDEEIDNNILNIQR